MTEILCAEYQPSRVHPATCWLRPPLKPILVEEGDVVLSVPLVKDGYAVLSQAASDENENKGGLGGYDERSMERLWISEPQIGYRVMLLDGQIYGDKGEEASVQVDIRTGEIIKLYEYLQASAWRCAYDSKMYLSTLHRSEQGNFERHLICRTRNNVETLWKYQELDFDWFALDDSCVVLTDGRGTIHGLDTPTGRLRWKIDPLSTGAFRNQAEIDDLPNEASGLNNFNRVTGFPVIYQGIAVAPMLANHLIGIDVKTGEIVWKEFLSDTQNWIRHAYGDTIYTFGGGRFQGRKMSTGEQTFEVAIDRGSFEVLSGRKNPVAWNFTCSETHFFVVDGGNRCFYSVDRETGVVEWVHEPKITVCESDFIYVANGRLFLGEMKRLTVFEGVDGYVPPEK